jgi:hypothetical protein
MNHAIYRLLLHLYPADVRERWAEDMTEAFAGQLADSWWDAWCCALFEVLQIALPMRTTSPALVIPCVSAAGSGILFAALIWSLGNSIKLLSAYHHLLAKLVG